jgi:hypothetical protein
MLCFDLLASSCLWKCIYLWDRVDFFEHLFGKILVKLKGSMTMWTCIRRMRWDKTIGSNLKREKERTIFRGKK